MKEYTLKSLIGKYIAKEKNVEYCHVETAYERIREREAIATVIMQMSYGKTLHIVVEAKWETDEVRTHRITGINILLEDEIYGNAKAHKSIS